MPKYIDLLRSHQPGKGGPTDQPESAGGDKGMKDSDSHHPQADWPDSDEDMPVNPRAAADNIPDEVLPADAGDKVDAADTVSNDPKEWISQCTRIILSFLKAAANRRVVPIEKLWHHLKPQVATVINDPRQLSALELIINGDTRGIREMSEDFGGMLEKSMNMLMLSIKIGPQLRMSEQTILSLLLAGMLHHAGLARVPIAIRQKSSALTREERVAIRNATREGVEYLRECGVDDADILLAIAQSQERIDGSGPLGLRGNEITYLARIVGLLSFFEALIHYRPYRQRMLPRDAIRDIILHHKAAFDADLLKALIDAASLYPIGTYVQLNSGDIGQVVHIHPRLPLRPVVRLCMDRGGHPIEPREVDLQEQTTLQIERCMYPEDLEFSN